MKPAKQSSKVSPVKAAPAKAAGKYKLTLITGNKKKLEEFSKIMTGSLSSHYEVCNQELDLEEIQGTPQEIVTKKAKLAS